MKEVVKFLKGKKMDGGKKWAIKSKEVLKTRAHTGGGMSKKHDNYKTISQCQKHDFPS